MVVGTYVNCREQVRAVQRREIDHVTMPESGLLDRVRLAAGNFILKIPLPVQRKGETVQIEGFVDPLEQLAGGV